MSVVVEFDPRLGIWASAGVLILHFGLAWWNDNNTWVTAGGALVIVIGVVRIARSILRLGEQRVQTAGRTRARLVREVDGKLVSAEPQEDAERYRDARAELRVGPALVIAGTLVNGYGGLVWDGLFK